MKKQVLLNSKVTKNYFFT